MDKRWQNSGQLDPVPGASNKVRLVRWISAETPPEKNGTYLACGKNGDVWMPFYHAGVKRWWLGGMEINQVVWYWAEIPETPEEG